MAQPKDIKVSRRNGPSYTVTVEVPENLQDPKWEEITSDRDADIHELALSAFIVRMQQNARQRLDRGEAVVQAFCDNYRFGARTDVVPTLDAGKVAELSFTPEQLAYLREAGARIAGEGEDEAEDEAA